jgi:hypothetical protein
MQEQTAIEFPFRGQMMDFAKAARLGCWGEFAEHTRKMLSAKLEADMLSDAEIEFLQSFFKDERPVHAAAIKAGPLAR